MTRPPRTTSTSSIPAGWLAYIRDPVLFLGGLAGMVWEAGFVQEPRTILVMAYLAALGLPAFTTLDKLLRRDPASDDATSTSREKTTSDQNDKP